jgi:hypothetical protein
MDWTGATYLVRPRGTCYPTAHYEFDSVQPERSFKDNKYSAWAALDGVSLVRER